MKCVINLVDRVPKPDWVGEASSSDIAQIIFDIWGFTPFDQGKVKIRSGRYRMASFESIERFALWAKAGFRHIKFDESFRRCGHYATDLMGQFHHHWQGVFFGVIIYNIGTVNMIRWHEINIVFGGDPIKMRFWNSQDEIWQPNSTVVGRAFDEIWHP